MKNNKENKGNDQAALAGTGKAMNMMPSSEKIINQGGSDPAIKKESSYLLEKKKKNEKKEKRNEPKS